MQTKKSSKLLLVETPDIAALWAGFLQGRGWNADIATRSEEAIKQVHSNTYDLCIVAERLRDNKADALDDSGIRLIRDLAAIDPALWFIVKTDFATVKRTQQLLNPASRHELRVLNYVSDHESGSELIEAIEKAPFRNETLDLLYDREEPPRVLVEVVSALDGDLMRYLKNEPRGLYQIQPQVFEEIVAELLSSYGWKVNLTRRTRDGGYDIFAIKKDSSGLLSSWIIECKRYKAERKVGIGIVRSLYAVKNERHVGMAMLATTSHFSNDVRAFKSTHYDLELKDFDGIVSWIQEYRLLSSGSLYIKR